MDESLQRLQIDYIDLYQLHNPTVDVIERGAVWEVLERAKQAGKIRHYGVSINTMEEGIAAVKDGRAETIQVEYNLLAQEPAEKIFPLAHQANVGIIARVPLRRGILTGKMTVADETAISRRGCTRAQFQRRGVRQRAGQGRANCAFSSTVRRKLWARRRSLFVSPTRPSASLSPARAMPSRCAKTLRLRI